MMRAPTPSEPKSNLTFPTYQVPQPSESAMRGSAPHLDDHPVQPKQVVNSSRAAWGGRADPPISPPDVSVATNRGVAHVALSVITGSSCRPVGRRSDGNSNLKMQSVTDNCLLNSVTVPKIQRNGRLTAAHNNLIDKINNNNDKDLASPKLVRKFGALPLGRDIPNQKADEADDDLLLLETQQQNDDNYSINRTYDTDSTDTNVLMRFTAINEHLKTDQEHLRVDLDECDINKTNMVISLSEKANRQDVNDQKDEKQIAEFGADGSDDLCHINQTPATRVPNKSTTIEYYYAPLRLRGGGESSLSTGTSGWGSPPNNQASNNNANNATGWGTAPANQNNTGTQQWNNANRPPASNQGPDANKPNATGQQPPTTQGNQPGGWGQPPVAGNQQQGSKPPGTAGTNQVVAPNGPQPVNNAAAGANGPVPPNNNNSTTAQLEQLKNMRESIFSQDGWGGQHVNQETNWDIPTSPEPPIKMDSAAGGPPPWKPPVNNGTELWEANLRNGGQPPPQPEPKTPWGHTPRANIGGTWGEDDDAADSSNVWTGVPNNNPQQWGNNVNNGMWGGAGSNNGGGGGAGGVVPNNPAQVGGGWGDPRSADPRMAGAMDNMRPDMRAGGAGGMDPRQMDPRQMPGGRDMRVDLGGGITGRLNGAGVEFWGQSGPIGGPGGMPPNKMPMGGPGNGPAWDEPSPPTTRRGLPNYDDGTSLWGNPQPGSHWKDLPTGAGGAGGMGGGRGVAGGPNGPPGMAPNRGGPPKPDGAGGVWGGGPGGGNGGRNGGWDELGGGAVATPGWEDPNAGPWPKQKMGGPGGLWDNELDWGHKNIRPQLTKEMVWNSKQFKMLVDMGYKKEDVESALRMKDMNMDESLDLLSSMRARYGEPNWGGRHDDHFDHSQFQGMGGRGGFPNVGGPSPLNAFPPNNTPNLSLNNMPGNGGQGNNSLINNISPAVMQKMLSQQGGAGGLGGSQAFGGIPSGNGRPLQQSQPSTQQLRMLVQQIQMAVQAGYLNHQILNQPLAPHTLVLLNQLLQHIKNLQNLDNQHKLAAASNKNNAVLMQYSVAITKTKQHIMNIQNQITAQQALYVKQQQGGGMGGGYDSFKSNPMHESLNALEGQFGNLGLKEPQVTHQQSRLNQWINKEKDENNEFSRAPGSSSKPTPTSPNMPLGLTQPDGPWSSGRTDTGWPDSTGGADAGDKDAQWAAPTQPSLTDLVPEFEPGKPWKGNQIKIEDDPSITPGSVVRSPLSIASIKPENELFSSINSSKSPPASVVDPMASLSLSSSTWSFNPPSTSSAFTSSQVKLPNKGGLDTTVSSSELWAPKSRGPPPGLSNKGNSVSSLANGWSSQLGGGNTAAWGGNVANPRNSGNWGGSQSQWLLLRNLTAQIDGATLRTLCMQHGPLQSFCLHLPQGFALAKYSTPNEATKAQATLNNCVLGNTTILAENPTDWDAQTLLKSVANQQGGGSGGWQRSSSNPTGDTWSTGWPNNSTSLWSNSNLDSNDPARATPSNLNSFLPNDLLGGESM